MPPLQPESGGTNEATNAGQLNQVMGKLIDAGSSGSAAVLTALASIASAITASLIGGTTGTTDNRILRSKGTGGFALDASPVAVDDSSNITPSTAAMALRTNTSNTNTLLLQAYDVDGAAYTTVATATAGNTPTFDLLAGTTKGGAAIAVVTQTDFISGLIPTVVDRDYKIVVKLPYALTITETTTISASGTSTFTFKLNTTALGGTANAVSSSEVSQAHSSSNVAAAGDDIVITASSTSSCLFASFTITFTRTLAAS